MARLLVGPLDFAILALMLLHEVLLLLIESLLNRGCVVVHVHIFQPIMSTGAWGLVQFLHSALSELIFFLIAKIIYQ